MRKQAILLLLMLLIPSATATELSILVVDISNNPVPNAVVSYQNGAAITNSKGQATISNIPTNLLWLFTVSADNYNIYTEYMKFTTNLSYKTFTISQIQVSGEVISTPKAQMPTETAINIRFHVTDTDNVAVMTATVNVLGKLRYTNIYGDVDFPLKKGTKAVDVAISKEGYSSFTDRYTIPDTLVNDDYKITVQLTPVNPSTPSIFEGLVKMKQPVKSVASPAKGSSDNSRPIKYAFPFSVIVLGLILMLLPDDEGRKQRK